MQRPLWEKRWKDCQGGLEEGKGYWKCHLWIKNAVSWKLSLGSGKVDGYIITRIEEDAIMLSKSPCGKMKVSMWLGGLERRGRLGRDRQRGLNVDHLCVHRMWQEWELKGSPKACKGSGEAGYLDLTITWEKQKMLWSRVWKVSYVNDVPLYVDIYVCRSKGTCVYTCVESRGLHQGLFSLLSNLVFETGLLIGPRDERFLVG